MYNFPGWLQEKLNERGWSQADLAKFVGVSRQVISRYVNNERRPDEKILLLIARAFHLPPEEVFREAGLLPEIGTREAALQRIGEKYASLTPESKAVVDKFIDFQLEQQRMEEERQKASNRSKADPLESKT